MNLTSAFCQAQAALQRERAANSNLSNVRRIAEKAMAAWTVEGAFAEARERRGRGMGRGVEPAPLSGHDALPEDCREPDDDELPDDPTPAEPSENPDREHAAA